MCFTTSFHHVSQTILFHYFLIIDNIFETLQTAQQHIEQMMLSNHMNATPSSAYAFPSNAQFAHQQAVLIPPPSMMSIADASDAAKRDKIVR